MAATDLLSVVERIKEILIERATTPGTPELATEYKSLRAQLVAARTVAMPECVQLHRTLAEFWPYIQDKSGQYAPRRALVAQQFGPLFDELERGPRGPAFARDREVFFSKVARLLIQRGQAREAYVLAASSFDFSENDDASSYSDGTCWNLKLRVPDAVYTRLTEKDRKAVADRILDTAREIDRGDDADWIAHASIAVDARPLDDWRRVAKARARGEGVNNQGRVRSANLPSQEVDGLLFRSQPEILLYRALKSRGITFAPLPVFLRGGPKYQRIEPDFVVIKDRSVMVIEVDGDVHTERPPEADERTRLFKLEGALIEHVSAAQCDTEAKANACVDELLANLEKWRIKI